AETGKPIIMSTGMATLAELDEAVRTIRATGNDQIVLLKCTSTYPAEPTDSNLRTIPHLKELFGCEVGLSDHTLGIGVAVAAVALGATVIEKHFTLSRAEGGVDAAFSLEPHEMKLLVEETQRAYQALGRVQYGPTEAEKKSLVYRRSLYFVKDMAAGEIITPECMRSIRPGYGLPPKYYDVLLGKRVNQAIERGTPVSWAHIG
ncbi:MAG: N-acetylneuraminate synthase family protein, partial [Oscillatoriaceae bacterium SKW80]|nr:N-acetylneuraminate synthase family protein [Oscillatoriaceae bacterium SKW80]HIK29530.1 N-acetylneuraminate synthase family protein [Oscillatoriaceae cyanobacterium M7585_C2015_266]